MIYKSGFGELIPPGYRFAPTPEELITNHLLPKVRKMDTSKLYSPIKELDVYGNDHVWMKECAEYDRGFARNTRYYFTNLKRKSETGSRFERGTHTGKWKEERDDVIKDPKTGMQIGSLRSFSYQPKNKFKNTKEIKDRKWNMMEYRLDGPCKDIEGSSTLVLCQVKETTRPKKYHNHEKTLPVEEEHTRNDTATSHQQVVYEAAPPVTTLAPQDDVFETLSSSGILQQVEPRAYQSPARFHP